MAHPDHGILLSDKMEGNANPRNTWMNLKASCWVKEAILKRPQTVQFHSKLYQWRSVHQWLPKAGGQGRGFTRRDMRGFGRTVNILIEMFLSYMHVSNLTEVFTKWVNFTVCKLYHNVFN